MIDMLKQKEVLSSQKYPSRTGAREFWRLACKQQSENYDELVDGMAQDVLHHGPGDQGLVTAVWFAQQQRLGGRLSGQRQGRQSVHDEVDPEHLHGL